MDRDRQTRLFDWQDADDGRGDATGRSHVRSSEPLRLFSAVTNPPYQMGTKGTSDRPIYPHFMDLGSSIAPIASFITPARFLFNAGKTSKEWNRRMLSDSSMSVVRFFPDSASVFPGTSIMGGIAVTSYDRNRDGNPIGDYSPMPCLRSLNAKAHATTVPGMDSIAFQQCKIDLGALASERPECGRLIGSGGRERRMTTSLFGHGELFSESPASDDDIRVLGIIGGVRHVRHFPRRLVDGRNSNLDAWKVIVPASNGSSPIGAGRATPVIGRPVIGAPGTGFTQSFISFGCLGSQEEAQACLRYVQSRFARALLGILKITQHNHVGIWRIVPVQEFGERSGIDWSLSQDDVDAMLYEAYGVSDEERQFLLDNVAPLDAPIQVI